MNRGTSDFNFNLLLVFDAVMQERNLTRAASRLGLSHLPLVMHWAGFDTCCVTIYSFVGLTECSRHLVQSKWRGRCVMHCTC